MKSMDHGGIDGNSVALQGLSIAMATIHWMSQQSITGFLTLLTLVSTLTYNGIRIYKELKRKENERNS